MPPKVYFGSARQARLKAEETLPAKLDLILEQLNLRERVKDENVCLKMHTGNNIGYSTVHPVFVRKVVNAVLEGGGKPFIVDVPWDVSGADKRGYTAEALAIVEQQQSWYRQLEEAVNAAYAAGGRRQNDLFRIAMERELLEEDEVRLRQTARTWDAELGRWLGADADRARIESLPDLSPPLPRETALNVLAEHPVLAADMRRVDAGKLGVELAKQQYRPSWALDLSYGVRDGEDAAGDSRPDFFSAMVSFELPIFPAHRQDRRVAAAVASELAVKSQLEDRQREIHRRFETAWSDYQSLEQRTELFEQRVLPAALANVESTRLAYQNDVVPFDEMVRSEESLLDTRLGLLRLRADRLAAVVELHYLTGDLR